MTTPIGIPASNVEQTLDRLNTPSVLSREGGLGSLDQADFLRLLTTQLANQDPLEPTNNEQMLAQLAQFSSLDATARSGDTLKEISAKLDALTATQEAAIAAAVSAAEAATRAAEAAERATAPASGSASPLLAA